MGHIPPDILADIDQSKADADVHLPGVIKRFKTHLQEHDGDVTCPWASLSVNSALLSHRLLSHLFASAVQQLVVAPAFIVRAVERREPGMRSFWHWRLYTGSAEIGASAVAYSSREDAEREARDCFTDDSGSAAHVDLELPDGTRERLR